MASEKLHIIHLEAHEDAVSARDKMGFARAPYVLLVWPEHGTVLQRKLDLLLLQRHASRMQQRLALVTNDPVVMEHAHDLSISVFPDEQSARRGRWQRPRHKVVAPPTYSEAQAAIAEHIYRQRQPLTPAAWRRRQMVRWGTFMLLVLAFGIGLLLAAPSASVTITPASKQVYETVSIVADPALTDIDIENFRMPAAVVSFQASSHVTVGASGTERAGATRSQGLVTFTNYTDQPLLIPLGTVVSTGGTIPVRFETLIETTLTAGPDTTVQVPIQALEAHAGGVGNIEPGAINRVEADFDDLVSVTNPNATYGGTVQERRVVTAQDHERLLVLARQQVLQNARDLLLHQLTGEQFLVPGSVSIIQERVEWTNYSAIVGDAVESVSLDLRADVQAVVVDERQAQQVAFAGLAPYVEPGLEISPEALSFARGDIIEIAADGRVTFLMIVRGNIAVAVNAEQAREHLTGLRVSEARARLERELLLDPNNPPRIETWPAFYSRMPLLSVRINVEVRTP